VRAGALHSAATCAATTAMASATATSCRAALRVCGNGGHSYSHDAAKDRAKKEGAMLGHGVASSGERSKYMPLEPSKRQLVAARQGQISRDDGTALRSAVSIR